ncbi:MAG: hypothetical protein M0C28_31920 [Candidatus Moduliflexus flocculans]|nr:hypothetical protein [Candidatus Moduliflexus flocculans]
MRISVRQNADGTGPEIASFDSMVPLVPLMLNGTYNPGQLVIAREILPGSGGFNFDTAPFSGNLAELQRHHRQRDGARLSSTHLDVTVPDGVGVGRDRPAHQHRAAAVRRPGGRAGPGPQQRAGGPADGQRHHTRASARC